MGLAAFHTILEFIQLTYEARACKTSLTNYCIACFNGRFGWVPFVDDLYHAVEMMEHVDEASLFVFKTKFMVLEFDHITYSNIFVNCRVPFKFSSSGVSTLCQRINDLPAFCKIEFDINVGSSIEELSMTDLHEVISSVGRKT